MTNATLTGLAKIRFTLNVFEIALSTYKVLPRTQAPQELLAKRKGSREDVTGFASFALPIIPCDTELRVYKKCPWVRGSIRCPFQTRFMPGNVIILPESKQPLS